MAELGPLLERAYRTADAAAAIARDPVRFPRRYSSPADAEIAGVFAAQLAYGRVELFGAVLDRLFAILDAHGGPRAFVDGFDSARAEELAGLRYRWNRPPDWALMCGGLQRLTQAHGGLKGAFVGLTAREALTSGLTELRRAVVAGAPAVGWPASSYGELPRGVRNWLSMPEAGSACKRWNLYLRWMVRPTTEGVDLGLWTQLEPAGLVIPLDTHVHRIAGFLGLTERTQANWRTAEQITERLRALDPRDPVRFDFALAHLGISGACRGHRVAEVCASCPLEPACTAPDR